MAEMYFLASSIVDKSNRETVRLAVSQSASSFANASFLDELVLVRS